MNSYQLARNTAYNLVTQGFLVVLAVWSIPHIVEGLSDAGFGLFSLIWAFIGYFTLLDFGISRASTKFLAEALAEKDEIKVQDYIWTSLTSSFLIGFAAGIILYVSAPFIVNILVADISLHDEALSALYLAAVSVPFLLVYGVLKGVQMALQRFDVINIFQATLGILQWPGIVVLVWLGGGLREVIALTVGIRLLLTIVNIFIMPKMLPGFFGQIRLLNYQVIKNVFTFGGWLTVSQVINPVFQYLDRIFISAFLTLSAVTYYTVPQEALTRLGIIPMSMTTTLFPAMTAVRVADGNGTDLSTMYVRSLKYLLFLLVPIMLILIFYASDILRLWVGEEFSDMSTFIFQIIAVGIFFNSLAQIPATVIHAVGRPDITAKFHIIELFIVIALNLVLIPLFGIAGAAISWSIRVILDSVLLAAAAHRFMGGSSGRRPLPLLTRNLIILMVVPTVISCGVYFIEGIFIKIIITTSLLIIYFICVWNFGFDERDRNFISGLRVNLLKAEKL